MGNGLSFKSAGSGFRDAEDFVPGSFKQNSTYDNAKSNSSSNIKKTTGGFSVGQRVFHVKFGYGKIVDVSGNQLDVHFEKAGTKKVIESYVEAA